MPCRRSRGRRSCRSWPDRAATIWSAPSNRIQEWTVPTKWSLPYQAKIDKNGDLWTGGMASDRIARINTKTGDMVEYPLPANTKVRNLYIDNETTRVTVWFGNNHGAAIVKLEPLD